MRIVTLPQASNGNYGWTITLTGTDLSLNRRLDPGQFETGYFDVDVPAGKPGMIVIDNTDANGDPVLSGTLEINYDNLSPVPGSTS